MSQIDNKIIDIESLLLMVTKSSESVGIFNRRIKSVDFSQLMDNTCKDCFLWNNYSVVTHPIVDLQHLFI